MMANSESQLLGQDLLVRQAMPFSCCQLYSPLPIPPSVRDNFSPAQLRLCHPFQTAWGVDDGMVSNLPLILSAQESGAQNVEIFFTFG